MISRLRGELVEKDAEGALLDVGGVGYRVSMPTGTIYGLPAAGEQCVLHTRMVVREDAMLLFGFATKDERASFDALTAVSRVGPKLAISVLSVLSPADISEAVARGDVTKLASVPGLGKKTAERLVLELKGKDFAVFDHIDRAAPAPSNGGGPYMEAREALTGLGYLLEEAEQVLNELPPQETVESYVKEALRRIGGRR